ncbi:MAG: hypothetical protein QW607_07970 [Desulfurococcaceae archaeon]
MQEIFTFISTIINLFSLEKEILIVLLIALIIVIGILRYKLKELTDHNKTLEQNLSNVIKSLKKIEGDLNSLKEKINNECKNIENYIDEINIIIEVLNERINILLNYILNNSNWKK